MPHPACSVIRNCSAVGKECTADDRSCQSAAVRDGLEVICERPEDQIFVYCPPGAQQRDSSIVWVLLGVAVLIAVGGGLAFWRFLLRRR